jgi:hypothetical protein
VHPDEQLWQMLVVESRYAALGQAVWQLITPEVMTVTNPVWQAEQPLLVHSLQLLTVQMTQIPPEFPKYPVGQTLEHIELKM